MTTQQIQIAETIRSLKLALRRNNATQDEDSSEDDSDDLHNHTNRDRKLRPSSQHAHTGRLDTTGGTQRYKRKVSHAGYERYVINKRPKLYDEDGDMVDPLDLPSDLESGDEKLYGEPLQPDPFGSVRLEELLRPLQSAQEVAEHPGYREAFTSKALTRMAEQAAEMVRRETVMLWKGKRLLERFRGDGGWLESGRFETEGDIQLLTGAGGEEDDGASVIPSIVETDGPEREPAFPEMLGETATQPEQPIGEEMDGVEVHDHVADTNGDQRQKQAHQTRSEQPANGHPPQVANGADTAPKAEDDTAPPQAPAPNPTITDLTRDSDEASTSNSNPSAPSHAMTTRARARSPQLPASPSPSPSDSASIPNVHPWFAIPPTALTDPDLGIPKAEADETRKYLLQYVQKQENIVRQLTTLYNGLQRTDRLRREVFQAAKAEGHTKVDKDGNVVTEMSDGEDWYDPSDWDLQPWELNGEGRLEKGKDEVEDAAEEEGRRVGGRRRRVVGR